MSPIQRKSATISVVLMIGTMVATVAVALLLVAAESQTNKFWLSLGFLLFAEAFTFLYPVMLMLRGKQAKSNLPLHLTTKIFILSYDVGVVALGLAALSYISFTLLLALHILLLLALVLGVGGNTIVAAFFGGLDTKELQERAPVMQLMRRCAGLRDRFNMIEIEAASALTQDFSAFVEEDLRFATGESVAGSEETDAELNACLDVIEGYLDGLEKIPTPEMPPPPSTENTVAGERDAQDKVTVAAMVSGAEGQLKVLRQRLQRREDLISELRRQ